MKSVLLVALLIAGSSTDLMAQEFRIYIAGTRSKEGFVESQRIEDSANDIRGVFATEKDHKKVFRIAEDPSDADIILEVTESGNFIAGTTTDVRSGIFGGVTANQTAKTVPGIKAVIKLPGSDYRKELFHVQQMFWKDLAKQIVNQFDSWFVANISTLRDRQKK